MTAAFVVSVLVWMVAGRELLAAPDNATARTALAGIAIGLAGMIASSALGACQ